MNETPAETCAAFERAAQICRYYLKHQNRPSRWEDKSEYEKGVQVACDNLAEAMLEEAQKRNTKIARDTRNHAIFGALVNHCGTGPGSLSPDMVDKVRDAIIWEMEQGPCAWAFQQNDRHLARGAPESPSDETGKP